MYKVPADFINDAKVWEAIEQNQNPEPSPGPFSSSHRDPDEASRCISAAHLCRVFLQGPCGRQRS